MSMTMSFVFAAFMVLLALEPDYSARAETMPCEGYLAVNKMTASGSGHHKFVDGRHMSATVHSVGGCGTYRSFPSGGEYRGNLTFLSYDSSGRSQACLVKREGGRRVYDSFQGTVIEADGFEWMPKFSVDDIDALPTTRPARGPQSSRSGGSAARYDAWRESAVVFGIVNGLVVYPKLSVSSGTMLAQPEYLIKNEALAEMGINGLGDVQAKGAEFNDQKMLYNCPFSAAGTESRCRMSVEFTEPVSKLIILYAAAQKSVQDPNAAIFFSELRLPCSCMCSTTRGKGVMYTEDPLNPGTCLRTEAEEESDRTSCDMLATDKVCTFEYKNTLTRTGPAGSNGNYPCSPVVGPTMLDVQPYNPRP